MFFCFCVSILIFAPAAAFPDCEHGYLEVEIIGNSKTKTRTIKRLAKLEGECVPPEGVNAERIRQDLLNSHLFSRVEVEVNAEKDVTRVRIIVKDKWTIIPVPVLYTSGEQSGGGMMILESNLLGRKKMLMGGVFFGTRGNRYEGIYIDDAVWGSKWILVIRPLFMERILLRYDDEKEVYAYKDDFNLIFGILGYKITDHIAPAVGLVYRYRDLSETEDYPAPRNERSTAGAMCNLKLSYTKFVDYYDKGFSGVFTFEHSLREFGADTIYGHFQATFEFVYPISIVLSRTFLEGGWSVGEDVGITNYYRLGGEYGYRGIPETGLWVSDYVVFSQQFEQVLYRMKLGTFTIAEFSDNVFTHEDDPVQIYYSVGVGLRAYLKEIAIPAVGVDAGYSLRNGAWHISAYVGKVF